MVGIKTKEEIKILREGGRALASVMEEICARLKPGVSALEMDELAERLVKKHNGEPSFKNYQPKGSKNSYPFSLCVSLNDEVVHGLPLREKVFKEGDIVGLDLGMKYKGLYVDMAVTKGVGKIGEREQRLVATAAKALDAGIGAIKEGAALGDIGFAIQSYVESNGFSVVKKLVGHGVGYSVHEEPEVPNYGRPGEGLVLREGMVLALEPMINEGGDDVLLDEDGWTWKTADGSLSAHFEHTVAVTKNGAEVLTKRE